jgi:two-component system cell cycle response regulator
MLRGACECTIIADPHAAVFEAAESGYECILVSTGFAAFDPLRLCSQLRSLDRTRFLPIILIAGANEEARIVRALELGVNDYLTSPIDQQELIARMRTQVRRKRYNEQLRASVAETMEMAVIDPLTGLHNRRYLDNHLQTLFDRAMARRRPLSVMITDLDRFKAINDTYGHDGGDRVLKEFARRLRQNVRGIDLACRFGGEEFVVVMPDTDQQIAEKVAERVRTEIAGAPFFTSEEKGEGITVTVSVGVSSLKPYGDRVEELMKRADIALYEAKSGGRNRVVAKAA